MSAAKEIKRRDKNAKIIIYETAPHLGGRCRSFFDEKLGINIDNATHAIVGANKNASKFLMKKSFKRDVYFFDYKGKNLKKTSWRDAEDIALAVFNQPLKNVPKKMIWKVLWKMFPFFKAKVSVWFSGGDLSEKFIKPLEKYVDEIRFGWCLSDFKAENSKINCLIFGKQTVEINENNFVVSAMDAKNFVKIFGGEEFEFESIINIVYRTSMKITLPKNLDFMGVKNGLVQWVSVTNDALSVTISAANDITISNEELALIVWKEVCEIRGREAAFVPAYRVMKYPNATIKQDTRNNNLRTVNAKSKYKNLSMVGDWTVKDFPCSIEAAMISGKKV